MERPGSLELASAICFPVERRLFDGSSPSLFETYHP